MSHFLSLKKIWVEKGGDYVTESENFILKIIVYQQTFLLLKVELFQVEIIKNLSKIVKVFSGKQDLLVWNLAPYLTLKKK